MIAVAELLKKERLPGNYFAPRAYVQGDFELGFIENRQGNRLLALPNTLLEALYSGLEEEVGPAAGLVLFQCGKWWGKYFYRRFTEEVSTHYDTPLADLEMIEFIQCIKQCWKTYGWGVLDLDFESYEQGLIVATVENSAFAQVCQQAEQPSEQPACQMEAGLLSAFFSQLTGQELHCVQTACESMGAPRNFFVLGLAERIKVAEACLEEKQDHATIMMRLGVSQPSVAEPTMPETAEEQTLFGAEPPSTEALVAPSSEAVPEAAPAVELATDSSPAVEAELPVDLDTELTAAESTFTETEAEAPAESTGAEAMPEPALDSTAETTIAPDLPQFIEAMEATLEATANLTDDSPITLSAESLEALDNLAELPDLGDLEGFTDGSFELPEEGV